MNQDDLILLTGATGFLGTQVVRELLQREPRARLALLIRPRPGQTPAKRAESILDSADSSRVQVYAGDVSEINCGLDATTRQLLCAEATRVIHCAATVRFDHSLAQARQMNVEGTRKMLDFAAAMRSLRSFIDCTLMGGARLSAKLNPVLNSYKNTFLPHNPCGYKYRQKDLHRVEQRCGAPFYNWIREDSGHVHGREYGAENLR